MHQFYNNAAIHQPSAKLFDAVDLSAQQFVSAVLVDYVFRMGVNPRFVAKAAETSPAEMHRFSQQELKELDIVWEADNFEPWAIEPYGGGVVAFSRSKDKSRMATAFCRKDKVPRLLITGPWRFNEGELRQIIAGLGGIEVFGQQFPKEALSVRTANKAPAIEVSMARFSLAAIDTAKTAGTSISQYGPHVYWADFDFRIAKEGASRALAIAFRNCI
ncbi:hypothetical protein SLNSH_02775 [Alsobacter soli]|uniref:Uncharacterized protein n=1 Tax=Alsobacter soli TaxID=2109933 RepID=A0A2T1HYG5_9HYPH|nr:hypothetical protein SLNSH_02775 [Alsobacter soli]